MPGNRRLRGQARRSRQLLTAQLASVAEQTRVHKQHCARCKVAAEDVFKRCDEGWKLAKLETRCVNQLRKYDERHEDRQESLWE